MQYSANAVDLLRYSCCLCLAAWIALGSLVAVGADDASVDQKANLFKAIPRETILGTVFLVRPAWDKAIAETVEEVRETVRAERARGNVICYVSVPLSARGGGYRPINVEISTFVKRALEARYGQGKFWALAPGLVENELPDIGGEQPGGGEYLYMWTQILAGDDGFGSDFDMAYFVGPADMHDFFGVRGGAVLERIDEYISERSVKDAEFRQAIADNPRQRWAFIRYYGIRASISYSKGSRDEWNIFRLVNRRREIDDQVAMFFNRRALSPGASDAPVRPGYEQRK